MKTTSVTSRLTAALLALLATLLPCDPAAAAKLSVKGGSTDVSLIVFVQDSASTAGAGKTGLAYNTGSLVCYYVRPGSAAAQLTLATQTVTGAHADGGFVEVDSTNMPGVYRLDLSDTIVGTGVRSAIVECKGATGMVPVLIELDLNAEVNTVALSGTAQTARDIGASVLLSPGTGTGQISLASGAVTAGTVSDKTGYALSVTPPTAAQVRAEMDANSTKLANLDATVSSRSTYAGGAVASVTGAVGSVTGNVGGNVVGSVGSVTSGVTLANGAHGGAAATLTLGGAGGLTGAITGNLSGSVGSVTGAVGSVTAGVTLAADQAVNVTKVGGTVQTARDLGAQLDAAVSSRLAAASYTAPLSAGDTRAAVGLAAANLDAQLAAIPTADAATPAAAAETAAEAVQAQLAAMAPLNVYTAEALANAPTGSGTGLTAQETRDAMKLAPTPGDPAAASVDALLAGMPTAVRDVDITSGAPSGSLGEAVGNAVNLGTMGLARHEVMISLADNAPDAVVTFTPALPADCTAEFFIYDPAGGPSYYTFGTYTTAGGWVPEPTFIPGGRTYGPIAVEIIANTSADFAARDVKIDLGASNFDQTVRWRVPTIEVNYDWYKAGVNGEGISCVTSGGQAASQGLAPLLPTLAQIEASTTLAKEATLGTPGPGGLAADIAAIAAGGSGLTPEQYAALAKEATVLGQYGVTWGTTYPIKREGTITIARGDVVTLTTTLGAAYPLAGKKVYCAAKKVKTAADTTAIVNRECTITSVENRTVSITLTAAETATAGTYYYEFEVRNTDETAPQTAEAGTLNITEDVRK